MMQGHLKARKNVPVQMWISPHEVESSALDQLKNVADIPQVFKWVAAMPDVHTGMGATVGTVLAMKGAVIPAAVGVDIGCGMEAVRTNLEVGKLREKKLIKIRDNILERVPVGFNKHESVHQWVRDHKMWEDFSQLDSNVHQYEGLAKAQLGSLGGGNHFIEMAVDDIDGSVWVMLHSGSRRIGKEIADVYIARAKSLPHNATGLPDKALSTLLEGSVDFDNYMRDLKWAQEYAAWNRQRMLTLITDYLAHEFSSLELDHRISCHHNFAQVETHFNEDVVVIRKGAIQARAGEWGIIPGAMGAKSFLVRGLGNPDSFHSAPHGAGRKMSRSKAKKKYRFQDLQETMAGIVCNADRSTVDEIKHSYKSIDKVMSNAGDLVDPIYELEQIMNIKG